jgi:hypothetical protein
MGGGSVAYTRRHCCGAGAGYVNSYKMLEKPKIFILKFEVDFKNHNFVTLKNLLMIIYVFKKQENFLKSCKLFNFS